MQGDLLGDLLNLDLGPPVSGPPLATSSVQMGAVDLLGGGLDSLVWPSPAQPSPLDFKPNPHFVPSTTKAIKCS